VTTLPHPTPATPASAPLPAAHLAEVVRLYGLRQWVEQAYRQVKGALGWADFQVRADRAIRRHGQLVCCAFSFCWWAFVQGRAPATTAALLPHRPVPEAPVAGGKRRQRGERRAGAPSAAAAHALVARGTPAGAAVVGPVDHALALLACRVHRAPARTAATAP
jgi:hypothetical protein